MSLPSIQSKLYPTLTVFISHLSDSLHHLLANHRPWPELLNHTAFSRPRSFSEAGARLHRNVTYFRVNYALLVAAILVFSLATHPTSLLCLLLLCFSWIALYLFRPPERRLAIWGRYSFSRNEVLESLLLATALVLVFTSVGTVLLQAALAGAAAMGLHGAFRCPEDSFGDDDDGDLARQLYSS